MEKSLYILQNQNVFERIKKIDENGGEYWEARELMPLLGYDKFDNFEKVIVKAKESAKNVGQSTQNHFLDIGKMVSIGSGAKRKKKDYRLSRYACYLIAQNGDSGKVQIAAAQTYFAIQTRKQEVREIELEDLKRIEARKKLTKTEKKFADTLYHRGVSGKGIGEIRNEGDKVLFGGMNTKEMKKKLKIRTTDPLADYLPTVTLKAKDLASEITTVNTTQRDLRGKILIKNEHLINNNAVRNLLKERGVIPEELPVEEDVKKLEKTYSQKLRLKESSGQLTLTVTMNESDDKE